MQANGRTPGIWLFALFVFVLMAAPKTNIKVGPLPVYLVDVLLFFLLLMAQKFPPIPRGQRKFAGTVFAIAIFAVISEMIGAISYGTLKESVYITGRTLLALSTFFLAGQYVRSVKDLELVLKAVVLGLIITALLMILTSLPMTRGTVTELVFSKRFLEPAGGVTGMLRDSADRGVRGRTLVGVSILGASFINACWPLAALLLRWPRRLGAVRIFAATACVLAPMGVLMSYSRGPILATILVTVVAFMFGLRYVRRGILMPVAIGLGIVLFVGVGSQLFYFERLERSTAKMIENPYGGRSESERSLAYIEPFEHFIENPRFLIVGEGVTVRYASSALVAAQRGQATHAVFAIAYYSYGLIAAILYMTLIIRVLYFTWRLSKFYQKTVAGFVSQGLFLSMVAMVPWVVFGHAAVSTPRGAMLFFLIIGLSSVVIRFNARPIRRRKVRTSYDIRRNSAFG